MATPEPSTSPSSKLPRVVVIVLAVVAACLVVSVCAMVVLALLGPAVGNVFSNIITDLGTPVP